MAKSKAYLSNIDLLNLEIIEHIGQRLKSKELSSTDILLPFNVEVDDLEETSSVMSNGVYDFTESGVVEGSGDSTGVDSTHSVVGPVLFITLNSALHGNTTVEDDVDERRNRKDIIQVQRLDDFKLTKRWTNEQKKQERNKKH